MVTIDLREKGEKSVRKLQNYSPVSWAEFMMRI
jgi:hypothetical protein